MVANLRYVPLLYALTVREIKNRYQGSVGGILWLVLHPALLLATYTLVFGWIFRAPSIRGLAGQTEVPYHAFIAVALWPWLAFSESMSRGLTAIRDNASIVKKVSFPNEALVVSSVLATFVVHGAGAVVAISLIAAFGTPIRMEAAPIYLALYLCLLLPALGLALALSAVQVFMRDVEHLVAQFLQIFFYATPVLYSVSMVPQALQPYIANNPLGIVIDAMRSSIVTDAAVAVVDLKLLSVLAIFALVLAFGAFVFRRLAPYFEDAL